MVIPNSICDPMGFALPLFLAILFTPESLWWLVRQNRLIDAKENVRRLANQTDDEINDRVSQMCFTIRLENEVEHGSSYLDCFRGVKPPPNGDLLRRVRWPNALRGAICIRTDIFF